MTVEFRVPLEEPIDIAGSLELFRRSGDDLIDRWDGRRLLRAVAFEGRWVPVLARARDNGFEVVVDQPAHAEAVRRVVAQTFVAAPGAYSELLSRDVVLARLHAQSPGIRQIRQLDLFTALVRCISAQQVNLRWAATTRRRLAEAFGHQYSLCGQVVYALDPHVLASVDPADIRRLQFTTSKSVAIVAAARSLVSEPDLNLDRLACLDDELVIQRLVAIRGIGRWSAEWVLARTLGRPRVVAGDLGVRKAVGLAYGLAPMPSESEVRAVTAHWGQAAGVAQALVLHAIGEGILSSPPARRGSRAVRRQ